MIEFRVGELAQRLGATHRGADVVVRQVSTDTRSLEHGDLFVALVGANFDGHEFVDRARERGAAAAMVSRPVAVDLPVIDVPDTRAGLGRLGALWRDAATARIVALTGSNGKTTVKEMLASILARRGTVLATRGNLNNDIGVPLTLTRLQDQQFAVVEMGANHAGEIDYLSRLARPEIVLINNVARAHLEGFGSLAGVARAKSEIVNGLEPDGLFVFNADDAFASLWRDIGADLRCLTFGQSPDADVRGLADEAELVWGDVGFVNRFAVDIAGHHQWIELPLGGAHNRRNALAAIAVASALEFDPAEIAAGLATLKPVPGRLCPMPGPAGVRVIDDTYNANPDSVAAAIDVLATAPGRRILVLGDLAELGADADTLYAEIGHRARTAGIDMLFTLGPASRAAAVAYGTATRSFQDCAELNDALYAGLAAGDAVLVKGSRTSRMERVVAALAEERPAC